MSKYKKVPRYWWDFEGEDEIIVESDNDKYPIVARFKYNPADGTGYALPAVKLAEKYIEDLNAGRITPKSC